MCLSFFFIIYYIYFYYYMVRSQENTPLSPLSIGLGFGLHLASPDYISIYYPFLLR